LDEKDHGNLFFQTWDEGVLVVSESIEAVENCQLIIDGQEWMFTGEQCIDGMAHGEGKAVKRDGSAYISFGKFVLGKRISGAIVSLTSPTGT
jgi:hypothetical protein